MIRYFCTLFDVNYLTRGLALYDSLAKHCKNFHIWILCMDDDAYDILKKMDLTFATLIKLSDFEDKELSKIKSVRTHGEYCWTCTPSLPLYIFKHFPMVKLLSYLDSDLYFYSPPDPVFKEFGDNSIMIIPHRFTVNKKQKERKAGIYNVSMISFRHDKNGLACLSWWRKRCLEWCFNRQEDGKLGDQMYLNQFPKLFSGVFVSKHVGANVAPWNIAQFKVWKNNGLVYIDDVPLIFYHFLGLKIYKQQLFLPPTSYDNYGEKSINRKLIYDEYFEELYKQAAKVRRILPSFDYGFVKRSSITATVKEIIYELCY